MTGIAFGALRLSLNGFYTEWDSRLRGLGLGKPGGVDESYGLADQKSTPSSK